ncbi:MAG: sodium:solute symporter family protein, partial [Gammaproteobacteria bacterium]
TRKLATIIAVLQIRVSEFIQVVAASAANNNRNIFGGAMNDIDPMLRYWGWFFLIIYIGAMLFFGYLGMRRVKNSDDFATARNSYGPVFLAFALTATAASGGTFLGIPALGYKFGLPTMWYAVMYPLGTYCGLLICLRGIRRAGEQFGTRSIPEYLGDRFNSETIRILVALFSLLLMFYLAAQLLSGAVMFNKMMGLPLIWALFVTAIIVMIYILIGGAHADILTDGVQGALMLILAIAVTVMFIVGFGMDGGFNAAMASLEKQDPNLVARFHPKSGIVDGAWDAFAIFLMHLPLGLLPHVANKMWALKNDRDQNLFITLAFVFGMILPLVTFGGILARAILGDSLMVEGASANDAIPALFIATLPTWLAALIGAGVLSAIMSTADGLVVSSSQIFANDIYRRSIAPRLSNPPSVEVVDRVSLMISRVATIGVIGVSIWLAWISQSMNVAILIAAGVGGMVSAIAGPIFLGILWRGTTKAGALSGILAGAFVFIVSKLGLIQAHWFAGSIAEAGATWLQSQAPNPFACGALGIIASIIMTYFVSLWTEKPSPEHLQRVFGSGES